MLDKYKLWIKFKILLYKFTSFPTLFEVQFHLDFPKEKAKKEIFFFLLYKVFSFPRRRRREKMKNAAI